MQISSISRSNTVSFVISRTLVMGLVESSRHKVIPWGLGAIFDCANDDGYRALGNSHRASKVFRLLRTQDDSRKWLSVSRTQQVRLSRTCKAVSHKLLGWGLEHHIGQVCWPKYHGTREWRVEDMLDARFHGHSTHFQPSWLIIAVSTCLFSIISWDYINILLLWPMAFDLLSLVRPSCFTGNPTGLIMRWQPETPVRQTRMDISLLNRLPYIIPIPYPDLHLRFFIKMKIQICETNAWVQWFLDWLRTPGDEPKHNDVHISNLAFAL